MMRHCHCVQTIGLYPITIAAIRTSICRHGGGLQIIFTAHNLFQGPIYIDRDLVYKMLHHTLRTKCHRF